MLLIPKNWASFQHYKDRSPPWVKLHKELLDDRTFQRLPVASRALAPMLWLLASESKDGTFDGSVEELAFRLRCSESEVQDGLTALIDKGFFLPAGKPLAKRKQVAVPEAEAERETEGETEAEYPVGFESFWAAWPKSDRKQAKGACFTAWKKAKAEPRAALIVSHVERMAASAGWTKNGGEYIPAPLVYLNRRSWEGADGAPAAGERFV